MLISLFCISGCGSNSQQTLKEINDFETEVKNNYNNNSDTFNQLKSCFGLKYIKAIDFKKNDVVVIDYKMNDSSKWEKTEISLVNKEIKSPLLKEGITTQYLFDLKMKLSSINANNIWIIDDHDITKGFSFKKIRINYLGDVNDFHFFYMLFDRPLDAIEESHYTPLTQDNMGGVLDKAVIYYCR
jgi:hypothetical protein